MSKPDSQTTGTPMTTLRQFLRGLSTHYAPEDDALSAATLRLMISDFREHARRFHAEMQNDQ